MIDAEMRIRGLLQMDQIHQLREKIAQHKQLVIRTNRLIERAIGIPAFETQLNELRKIANQTEFEIEVWEHKISKLSNAVTDSGLAELL